MNQQTANAATPVTQLPAARHSLVAKFAAKYSLEPDKLMAILKATCFKLKDGAVSNEQMAALLVVADQYGLNPFTREIFAFPDKQNGIVPVVGVDGWSRIINNFAASDGFEFRQSDEMITPTDGKICPEWMEVVIYRKDRQHPIVVREYLDEVYRPPFVTSDGRKILGHWQTHTKRALRHKTLIQGARIAYGFSGIYDEDEAERIIEYDVTDQRAQLTDKSAGARLKTALGGGAETSTGAVAGTSQPQPESAVGQPMGANVDAGTAPTDASAVAGGGSLPIGTPKVKKAIFKQMEAAKDRDVLYIAFDEARLYSWPSQEVAEFESAYNLRVAEINEAG